MAISIQKAGENDYQAIVDLTNRAYTVPYKEGGLVTSAFDEVTRIERDINDGSEIIVAKEDNKIIGAIRLRQESKAVVKLFKLAVRPENRRGGVAAQLMEYSYGFAKNLGCKYIEVDVAKEKLLANYYKKAGFYIVKETPKIKYTEILMRRDI